MKWNSRFVEYSKRQGRTPEAQLAADKEEWPESCMVGFILWIAEQWRAFDKATGGHPLMHGTKEHAAFDCWLSRTLGG